MLASLPRLAPMPRRPMPSDDEALDAYSVAVSTVAERLIPSVASLRVTAAPAADGAAAPAPRSPSSRSATS